MTDRPPKDFDWVSARHECSLEHVFIQLQMDAEAAIEKRNALKGDPTISFNITKNAGNFVISRHDGRGTPRMIGFNLRTDEIIVEEAGQTETVRATVALNAYGECVLKSNNQEFFRWQLLNRVLGDFFFRSD